MNKILKFFWRPSWRGRFCPIGCARISAYQIYFCKFPASCNAKIGILFAESHSGPSGRGLEKIDKKSWLRILRQLFFAYPMTRTFFFACNFFLSNFWFWQASGVAKFFLISHCPAEFLKMVDFRPSEKWPFFAVFFILAADLPLKISTILKMSPL